MDPSVEILLNYLLSTLVYMKPVFWETKNSKGMIKPYVYQDESEWRYIPSDNFPEELGSLILPQRDTTIRARDAFSKALKKHKECWLKFDWKDVRYIMVPDEKALKRTISSILSLNIKEDEKNYLMSRIEISRRFAYDA